MRILHIIPSLNKGGAERLVLDICNTLNKYEDCEVKLITFRKDNSYSFLTNDLNWEVIPSSVQLSITGKKMINTANLQLAIEAYQPDIIHSHLFETEVVLSQFTYEKAKYFVHFHDNMIQFENFSFKAFFNKKKLTNFYEKSILLKAYKSRPTYLVAISKDGYQYLEKVFPKDHKKTLLHNAINTERFSEGKIQRTDLVLTTIGSLVDKKGHDLAILTVQELHRRGIPVYLNILGEGPNRKKLEDLITETRLTDFVRLHGNVDHPEDFLNRSMIYLHTASYEPFGLVLLEAMACGLPIVCADGKGNQDLIDEGENGFLVFERDPKILAYMIELLIFDTELYKKMKTNSVAKVQMFSMDNYATKLLELYKNWN